MIQTFALSAVLNKNFYIKFEWALMHGCRSNTIVKVKLHIEYNEHVHFHDKKEAHMPEENISQTYNPIDTENILKQLFSLPFFI